MIYVKPLIKEVQYHQFIHLIEWATCDNECDSCDWKRENYDNLFDGCLLKQLKNMIPKRDRENQDLSKLDYLKRKREE